MIGRNEMQLSKETLLKISKETGFSSDILEKVIRLTSWLNLAVKHPRLNEKFALKGGTALNLFLFNLPRLSVDIDLNFVGSKERKSLETEREPFEKAVENICKAEDLSIRNKRKSEAATSYSLRYLSSLGNGGNLKIDINYQFRIPLYKVEKLDSFPLDIYKAKSVPVLNLNELLATKLVAALARKASRDFFDLYILKQKIEKIDLSKVRLAFVVFGGVNRKDWLRVSKEKIEIDKDEMHNQLLPVLNKRNLEGSQSDLINSITSSCKELFELFLPLKANEREFLERLNKEGKICPNLLTNDPEMVDKILSQPQLQWKIKKVVEFRKDHPISKK